jgi:hypothetical protein
MKTAIQQLIERLEEEDINVPFLIKSVYIEKEKEQIMRDYKEGHFHLELDAYSPEKYYNQTYNQNK